MEIRGQRFAWGFLRAILRSTTQGEAWKTFSFCFLYLLLGLGYSSGFFASNALLISRTGTQTLFYVYLESSLFSLLLAGIFFMLADRFPRKKLFHISFVILGGLITLAWFLLRSGTQGIALYYSLRVLLYGVFTLTNLQYWTLASDTHSTFEARRRFPTYVAAGIGGDFLGGAMASGLALRWGSENLILIWAAVLLISPFLFWNLRVPAMARPNSVEKSASAKSDWKTYPMALLGALLIFWLAFSFFTYGVDYIFNTLALASLGKQDLLSSYFGKVTLISSAVVLLYQLFLAYPLTQKIGVDRKMFLLPLLYAGSLGLLCLFHSLWSVTVAEGLSFFFADFAAMALLQPILNLYPQGIRGRVKALSEGLGRPLGTLFLLFTGVLSSLFFPTLHLSSILFGLSLAFLGYPFIFKRAYRYHLRKLLYQSDYPLVSNAIQALGEPNKKDAVPELRQLLKQADRLDLKKTIILTLGRIQSREAFADIVEIFSVKDESLQIAVLESLGSYKNYESIAALFRLMKSGQNVSFQVRMSAIHLLTRLMGKKMIPFLLENLQDQDPRIQANAIESLSLLKDRKTIPVLLPFLEHPSNRVRANAASALFQFRAFRKPSLAAVEKLLQAENPTERLSALYAIGEMKAKIFEPQILRLLHVPDKKIIEHCAVALAKMKNPKFRTPLVRLLTDPEQDIGLEAARHIGRFPKFSRMILFEKIMDLGEAQRQLILQRLDQSPLDFSSEKGMLLEQESLRSRPSVRESFFPLKARPHHL